MSNLKIFTAFAVGGAIGAAAAWYATRKFYEDHMQEEIDSVKESYGRKYFTKIECSDEAPEEPNEIKFSQGTDDDIRREVDTHKIQYVQYSKAASDYSNDAEPNSGIYIIGDVDFNEKEGYSTLSLVWYTDGVLADWNDDEVIEDVEATVGNSWKSIFDKGVDTAYVRNDYRKCDYEILRSDKSYKDDVLPNKPPTLEERHDL